MSFKINHYQIIKKVITKELAEFVYEYFLLKRKVAKKLFEEKYISPFTTYWGVWNDSQIPNTYSHYADTAMETLLTKVQPIMEKESGVNLIPTYSYARIYKKGDILHKHKDRASCEISTTLNLGGDSWPIFLEPNNKIGILKDGTYFPGTTKGVQINLEPGEMLMYRGCELEHWRDEFKGENCGQVFLHYNDAAGNFSSNNKFDKREFIGLPGDFKKR